MSNVYVNKLSYLNYSTVYSAKGDIPIRLSSYACFGSILNRGLSLTKEHYEIYVVTDPKNALVYRRGHLCLLSEKGVKKHLMLARRLFPFSYTVEPSKFEEMDAFKITIDLNADKFYHRYLLTWVRYLWEFPFNLILNDALHMKHNYLNRESITNLFVLCANCYSDSPAAYSSGHSISCQEAQLLKEQELKARIKEFATPAYRKCINDIYPYKYNPNRFKIDTNGNGRYLDYWLDPATFEERAKVYLKEYQKLKA